MVVSRTGYEQLGGAGFARGTRGGTEDTISLQLFSLISHPNVLSRSVLSSHSPTPYPTGRPRRSDTPSFHTPALESSQIRAGGASPLIIFSHSLSFPHFPHSMPLAVITTLEKGRKKYFSATSARRSPSFLASLK